VLRLERYNGLGLAVDVKSIAIVQKHNVGGPVQEHLLGKLNSDFCSYTS
jgi:hypothetical protein